jgi:transcriptional regulator GlxA family with amidase domain
MAKREGNVPNARETIRASLVTLPETSASVLYGLYDVLTSVGRIWPVLTGKGEPRPAFEVQIVAHSDRLFRCFGGAPVAPDGRFDQERSSDLVMIPDLNFDMDSDPRGRWPEAGRWIAARHREGALVATVCTGSVLLADSGLLDGHEATTHWAAQGLFARHYPKVTLHPERILVASGEEQRLITSGGAASWEDLSLYLIDRFCGREEAARTAKIFLFGDRSEGQLPYAAMTRPMRHEDAVIADCQVWIADHYAGPNPVSRMVARTGLPARSFKRRFRAATGFTPVAYVQTLRIEEAKQQLETTDLPTDAVGRAVGYADPASFRRLFKRQTGVTPARYRQRFQNLGRLAAE